ncbi:MAG: ATP-binding cassette domain-containing protein [Muribaculaceae bacterium]|nr:ATP-binding cassette domain-containing protein [Muribaculaceae bacterium]
MSTITLDRVLPQPFTGIQGYSSSECGSDVWHRTIQFKRGVSYLVEARSGTGKSSLCSFIYGNRSDYLGRILFDDTEARMLGIDGWCDLRRSALSLLPQEMRLFPELTVMENVLLKNTLTDFRSEGEIRQLLKEMEMDSSYDTEAGYLSIGQQQRVALVRALCQPFDFLILDEPVSHLDAENNRAAAIMVQREAEAQGAGIIATSVGNPLMIPQYSLLQL